ncbi:MAG: choice-of-anchor tandem repeat GloVer-containing protein [Bacteroidia bacterium]
MKKNILLTLSTLIAFHFLGTITAKAQYTTLLDFTGITNGSNPHGDLIYDGNFLYGMTFAGGQNNFGIIFKIKPDGTGYSKLLEFDNSTNGASPYGSLVYDGTFLYGTTLRTIFKIKPDGTGYSTLLDYMSNPNGSLISTGHLISDGTFLYGMTPSGGTNICDQYGQGCGIIYKIKTDGTGFSKLHDFSSTTGARPWGSLFYDGTYLYGMTSEGGSLPCQDPHGCGVIFKIKPDGTGYTNLHNFDGITSGGPTGSLISDGTFLYGLAGSIFKIKPDGTGYSQLSNFAGANGSIFYDGTFIYGMTREGGTSTNCGGGCGTIFKVKTDGTEYSKLLDFTGINGSDPMGSLISDGTSLYGMTRTGGTNNMGVIFSFNLSKPTNISQISNNTTEINIFPNPTNSEITLSIASVGPKEEFTIKVTDPLSKTVYFEIVKNISGSFTKQIDLSTLPKGIYFVVIESANSNISKTATKQVKKIVLQ